MIVSKRHPLNFYFALGATALFGAFLNIIMLLALFAKNTELSLVGTCVFLLLIAAMFVYNVYFIWMHFKKVPIIRLDKHRIAFGTEVYPLAMIQEVMFTGKIPIKPWIVFYPGNIKEGTSITFKNGRVKYIYDDMYSNAWELKLFLEKVHIEKQEYIQPMLEHNGKLGVRNEPVEVFKRHPLLSFAGAFLWLFFLFIVYFYVFPESKRTPDLTGRLQISLMWLMIFLFFSSFMFYAGVTENYLVIKNHHIFWFSKVYRLSDIREVVIEQNRTRQPFDYSVRIITNRYKSDIYKTVTLSDGMLTKLKNRLMEVGVEVRDERV